MDDLIALMGETHESKSDAAPQSVEERNLSTIYSSEVRSQSDIVSVGVIDPLTKIRIIDRMRSKVEIIDSMSSYNLQFQSTESIANMSKAMLSTLIVKPSENDIASGKSNIMTMGIVFSNSGTKLSKNGRGFCIFKVGDLHTGPTISVLLFGSAYLTHLKRVQSGDVIAVLAGTLLPSQNGRETRISMSVNDSDQIISVGKAMDYGLCCMVEKKRVQYSNSFQSGSNDQDVRCQNYVDLRCTKYCKFHLKKAKEQHQSQREVSIKNGSNKKQTFIQIARKETGKKSTSFEVSIGGNMKLIMPGEKRVIPAKKSLSDYALPRSSSSTGGMPVSSALQDALSYGAIKVNPNTNISTDTKRLKSGISRLHSTLNRSTHSSMQDLRSISTAATLLQKSNDKDVFTDLLGEALKTDAKSSNSSLQSCKRHFSESENFDGGVQVPKPNSILFGRNSILSTPSMSQCEHNPATKNDVTPSPDQLDEIRQKQRLFSEKLLHKNSNSTTNSLNLKRKESKVTSSAADLLLDSVKLTEETRSSILVSKSKFSAEADSALYARNRQSINELEKQEESLNKRGLVKQAKELEHTGFVKKEYVCNTCRKVTKFRPQTCVRQRHNVKLRREITKKEALAENRIRENGKATKEGGLLLGAGLEWSGWNHSNN